MDGSIRVGILTVSDRVSAGVMQDEGGPAVAEALAPLQAREIVTAVVPDELDTIAAAIRTWADDDRLDIVLTTGGTGLGPRDVTPEATLKVCERLVPGMPEAMRMAGLAQTPFAMISRGIAGLRGQTVIVNLPGSPGGAREGVAVILPVLAHAVATVRGAGH